jgi:hypothetical protein
MDKFGFNFVEISCETLNTLTDFISTLICNSLKAGEGPLKLGSQGTAQFAAPVPFSTLHANSTVRTDRKYCGKSQEFIITDTVTQKSKYKTAGNKIQ